jgi:hypothetical protein
MLMAATLLPGSPAKAAQPSRISLRLVNASRHEIREAYVSPSGSPGWGTNLLARKAAASDPPPTLKPGQRSSVDVTSACGRFDVRLVAGGGTEFLDDEVLLCDDDNVLTVTNNALRFTKAGQR